MPTSLQSRCRCAPPPEKGIPSASTVRLPMKAWPLFLGIAAEGAAQPAPHGDVRDAPRGCGCNRAGDEAAYLDGGAQHPDGHRQHGMAHLGELRAVGVARLFRCRRRGDERRDRRRDEVLRTKENPDIRVRHGHDGGRWYRHEVDVHADDRVELLGDGQAGHAFIPMAPSTGSIAASLRPSARRRWRLPP